MKIIVLGSTGLAGRFISNYLEDNYHKVVRLNRDHFDASLPHGGDTFKSYILNTIEPNDVVINCVGILKPQIKEVGEYVTFTVNTLFPSIVYDACKLNGAQFIHLCSDCVFKGDEGNYNESHLCDGTDTYAKTKSRMKCGTIIRTSFIGEDGGLMKWVLDNRWGLVDGYTNCIWNGITVLQLAKLIICIIRKEAYWEGVRHYSSAAPVSKHDLIHLINETYSLNISIVPTEADSIEGTIIPVGTTLDRSLSSIHAPVMQPTHIKQQLLQLYEYSKQSQRMGST